MEFTERQLEALDPIVVYDPNFTKDEDGNKVIRVIEDEPMWLVGVMCTRIENLAPDLIAFPYDHSFDPHTMTPVPDKEKGDGFTKLVALKPPEVPAEVQKEIQLRREFEAQKLAEQEAAFEQFKQTKEGK